MIFKTRVGATKSNNMPQLLPFFFVNQFVFTFVALLVIVYVTSKYFLPMFTEISVTRMYITKL